MNKLPIPLRVLFVCTHNRCRSILAETLLRACGGKRVLVQSGGSEPAGAVHPLTLDYLQRQHLSVENLYSKSWNDLGDFMPDVVITVCDSAAREPCPLWLGRAVRAHWGVPDPTAPDVTDSAAAFTTTAALLQKRIDALLALPLHDISAAALQARLDQIGLTNAY